MSFEIKPATLSDAESLNELVNSAYRGESSKAGWTTEADLIDGTRTEVSLIEETLNKPGTTILKYVEDGKVQLNDIITHRLPLSEIADGYSMFNNKEDNCVKVVLDPWK